MPHSHPAPRITQDDGTNTTNDHQTTRLALLVGGAGLPANREFAGFIAELDWFGSAVPVDLVAFSGSVEPGYTLATEIDAVKRAMDLAGAESAHLVGYSGGASVALAFASAYPHRVASLAIEEPAWVGNAGMTDLEKGFWAALEAALKLPDFDALQLFRELMTRPEAHSMLPPLSANAPWVPAAVQGIRLLDRALRHHEIDYAVLRSHTIPLYCAAGALSHPVFEERLGRVAEQVHGTIVDVYEGLHHLNPPHRSGLGRFTQALRDLWGAAQ